MHLFIYEITPATHQRITQGWSGLQRQAAEAGITLADDGAFSGKATGTIKISRDKVTVQVTDKPFWVPLGAINSKLKELLT